MLEPEHSTAPPSDLNRTLAQQAPELATSRDHDWVLDPKPFVKPGRLDFTRNAPREAAFISLAPQPKSAIAPQLAPAQEQRAGSVAAFRVPRTDEIVPLAVPRPPDLRTRRTITASQVVSGPLGRKPKDLVPPPTLTDNRSFFERLFGVRKTPAPALTYAALDSTVVSPSSRITSPDLAASVATAVYDISARVVYMPNGERLEAHSGLGDKIDDPRYVHVRMQGATPPGTYILAEREKLFHGVRALRLNPIGGSAAIHGRAGLLAHTYMLGPNGDSNGCISFKDYNRFLQAYLSGEVKRLVVTTGHGQDALPRIVNDRNAKSQRTAWLPGNN